MLDAKRAFLHEQAELSTVIASLQRANAYSSTASESDRQALRIALKAALAEFGERYSSPVSHEVHLKHISQFAQRISSECGGYLASGHLRIGVAQKALNLYLKFLWCYGTIPTPPHCPFDSRVIAKLPPEARLPWTRLDDLAAYEALVAVAKRVAAPEELAVWELHAYQGT